MKLDLAELRRLGAATGFRLEPLEKALRLVELLDALRGHPFTSSRLALKGGTALNLFVFDLPRLSVDIDLDYVGAPDRDGMLAEKPKLEQSIAAICGRLGVAVRHHPSEHAGGKWRLSYVGVSGRSGTIELDLNYLLRSPLWPPSPRDSHSIGPFRATEVLVHDQHELAAGKIAALFGRGASRDLFDVANLFANLQLDPERLRLAFVVHGAANRRDWRTVSLDDLRMDPTDADRHLVPMLSAEFAPDREDLVAWCDGLVAACRSHLQALLPLREREIEFLSRLNETGEIVPELATDDVSMHSAIASHPSLLWKAQNVQGWRRRGTPDFSGDGGDG
ncbi:MAG: nucleotidyl transferase AbiEii/AbiGii toxin family protein [Planctomycetes bacterium]|nr:nucleotidyl transferase AbiEii/AbiGii toxin family protein [Planctomycetota bacterium]